MLPRRNNARRANNNSTAARDVTRALKRMHVTGPPLWYHVPTRITDPSVYIEDSTYQRKVRIIASSTEATAVNINAKSIADAAGMGTTFARVVVNAAKFFGVANSSGLTVQAFVPNDNMSAMKSTVFNDYGVTGARRPCIYIKLNSKDNVPAATSNTNSIFYVSAVDALTGASLIGNFVIDLWVQFSGSSAVLYQDAENTPPSSLIHTVHTDCIQSLSSAGN